MPIVKEIKKEQEIIPRQPNTGRRKDKTQGENILFSGLPSLNSQMQNPILIREYLVYNQNICSNMRPIQKEIEG
jgi:hypothetical protein